MNLLKILLDFLTSLFFSCVFSIFLPNHHCHDPTQYVWFWTTSRKYIQREREKERGERERESEREREREKDSSTRHKLIHIQWQCLMLITALLSQAAELPATTQSSGCQADLCFHWTISNRCFLACLCTLRLPMVSSDVRPKIFTRGNTDWQRAATLDGHGAKIKRFLLFGKDNALLSWFTPLQIWSKPRVQMVLCTLPTLNSGQCVPLSLSDLWTACSVCFFHFFPPFNIAIEQFLRVYRNSVKCSQPRKELHQRTHPWPRCSRRDYNLKNNKHKQRQWSVARL